MTEAFDAEEVLKVASALRDFERRCDEIAARLTDKRTLFIFEREAIRELYTSLKGDLKAAAKYGTLSGRREALTRTEQCFYDPAVRRAALAMRPATNSHPILLRWSEALFEASSECSFWLHNLAKLPGAKP
jgi:hypothetical protein